MFVNGNHVGGANAEGFTFVWEYTGQIPSGDLNSGVNTIKIDLEDHGGLTAFDMQIRGERLRSVPDGGATIGLMAAGLTLCAAMKRKTSVR